MDYVLVEIDGHGSAYQEQSLGRVVRYADMNGATLFESVPPGVSSRVLDANPARPSWALCEEPEQVPTQRPEHFFISKLSYMNRFTEAELGAIYSAAKVNVAIEVWLAKFNAMQGDIDLLDPRTAAGVRALEVAGLIGNGRAGEILNV